MTSCHDLLAYRTWIFDCDGVLLNSNPVKSQAMHAAAAPYGEDFARALVRHHKAKGGVSRFEKFRYFFTDILGRPAEEGEMAEVLGRFAQASHAGMMRAEIADSLVALLGQLRDWGVSRLVVSGSEQQELRDVLGSRALGGWFDGIFGSPDSKQDIIERELQSSLIREPALFIGDSKYDHDAAVTCGLDFVFVSEWSEFEDWRAFFADKEVPIARSVAELLSVLDAFGRERSSQ